MRRGLPEAQPSSGSPAGSGHPTAGEPHGLVGSAWTHPVSANTTAPPQFLHNSIADLSAGSATVLSASRRPGSQPARRPGSGRAW